jgi:peptidoglycan/xylan/chitin deacetylase (PgdA/CDA1 family)
MYHRLTARTGVHPCSLAKARFRAQLRLLRALGYRSVSTLAVAAHVASGARLPARSVAITFDDGYLDTVTEALPVLLELGFTATCYVVAGRVGGVSQWTDPAPLAGWREIDPWLRAGMEVGAHSVTHPDLTALSDAALREEVAGAKTRLEDRLGIPVRSFAYPFNRVDGRVLVAVAKAGYEAACAGPEVRHSPHALSRVNGALDSWGWFGLQLLPPYLPLRAAYRAAIPRRKTLGAA